MPQDKTPDSPVNPAAKLWGGRFSEATDAFVEEFTASVGFDQRLYAQDITGSIAHARMLAAVQVLTENEADAIVPAWRRSGPRSSPARSTGAWRAKTCT